MKYIVLFTLMAACLCGSLLWAKESTPGDGVSEIIYYQMENGRFYSSAPLGSNSTSLYVAVGQRTPAKKGVNKKSVNHGGEKQKKGKRKGYVVILAAKGNTFSVMAEHLFHVTHNDRKWPTRVRTVAVVNQANGRDADIYITGRGGSDTEGIGFLRIYTWKAGTLTPGETVIMEQKQEGIGYTHGYSLKTGDIDGDGVQEAIYGGFFGKDINQHLSEDFADVRIFKKKAGGSIQQMPSKPFEQLRVPIRINALEVKDINGDAKAEIIIAGRSRAGKQEYSAFAMWSAGRVTYHVNRKQSLPGRFRTVRAMDIDGDQKDELITGGRIDMGEHMVANLQVWKLETHGVKLLATYKWTSDASTRLRALAADSSNKGHTVLAAGRTQLGPEKSRRWIGFIRGFKFKNRSIWPIDIPFLLDKGPETRIRDIRFIGSNRYLSAGFIMKGKKESIGFVMIR